MNALLIWYPKCSTCQKAKAWLDEHGVACETRHIVEETPTAAELADWHARSGLPLKRFFNTSGLVYKNEHIKDRLPGMSEEEQYALLAQNGMLIKRPLLLLGDRVLVGFRPAEWEAAL
ncbi:arsenate reductase family protein [Acetanaerobacterium sp. MSJ-12]|uniref:Arsenate reductase family protein n=1 Tax=Bittarella massiliensis (ex Durand et al. 2017) TaxID=1720313 RepID=A0AAW5KC85_9FIRM|nr:MULTISPECIES: arsenate reductase family protein [Oscillospiraceae]MBC2871536.1 arsenate reductase family protein [Bittarella massiliensis (ex Durand et al. 2017)]MBU5418965.1 arsenate reductase family protein [Acetanaerobacterium sp. MSJ-12]MCQ4949635.1 arsenate reductase family protein [Bittarella massiliensis (ex Durand et al. 2017)]